MSRDGDSEEHVIAATGRSPQASRSTADCSSRSPWTRADRLLNTLASAEVVDAQRRLRLMPGEAVTVRYAMDDGATGWLLETMSGATGRFARAWCRDLRSRATARREPGPGCLETPATSFSRRPLAESRLRPQDLARLLTASTPQTLPTLLVAARSHIVMPPPEGVAVVINAITERYPQLSVTERALVVAMMPPAIEVPELQALDDAIAKEADPSVLGVAIVTAPQPPKVLCSRLKACRRSGPSPGGVARGTTRERHAVLRDQGEPDS